MVGSQEGNYEIPSRFPSCFSAFVFSEFIGVEVFGAEGIGNQGIERTRI